MVSTASTTGARSGISELQLDYFRRIEQMHLHTPRLIGFGIGDRDTFTTACAHAHGAIIGSAFIKNLKPEALEDSIAHFIGQVR
jgi:tryptophan synthase alpha chain